MTAKRALITGVAGQDGAYLAKLLLHKGYEVFGSHRMSSKPNLWRLEYLGIRDNVTLLSVNLQDSAFIAEAIEDCRPNEIYHLAANSFVGTAFDDLISSAAVDGSWIIKLLEVIKDLDPGIRFFQASTAEIYGNGGGVPVTEDAVFMPTNPYAVTKLYSYWMTRVYREQHGLFACSGILFNHESPLRGLDFVTRKITNAVARIAVNLQSELELGDLDARRDWGYAPDYVKAMWLMLQQDEPDDYIIATNEAHTVREFARRAFEIAGLDWQSYVRVDEKFRRLGDVNFLQGDYSKAKAKLGWQPEGRFDHLVEIMVSEDLSRWQKFQKGEKFPWDICDHPCQSKTPSN